MPQKTIADLLGIKPEGIDDDRPPLQPTQAVEKTVEWQCSDSMRTAMESVGLYEIIKNEIETVASAKHAGEITLARARLETLGKTVVILKNVVEAASRSGSLEDDDAVSEISINLDKDESPDEDEEVEDEDNIS